MAYSINWLGAPGLLLLLIGVIFPHLPQVHMRPMDFWCKNDTRKKMMEMIEDKADCVGSDTLPSPVQLPCVGIRATEWANKTLQQKRMEVLQGLKEFQDGVEGVKGEATIQCQTSLLKSLARSITNHWEIVNSLQLQHEDPTASYPVGQNCSSQTSLDQVLREYQRLLSGKLEWLAVDIQQSICVDT